MRNHCLAGATELQGVARGKRQGVMKDVAGRESGLAHGATSGR